MRSTIIFCVVLVLDWYQGIANIQYHVEEDVAALIAWALAIALVMDIFELLRNKNAQR